MKPIIDCCCRRWFRYNALWRRRRQHSHPHQHSTRILQNNVRQHTVSMNRYYSTQYQPLLAYMAIWEAVGSCDPLWSDKQTKVQSSTARILENLLEKMWLILLAFLYMNELLRICLLACLFEGVELSRTIQPNQLIPHHTIENDVTSGTTFARVLVPIFFTNWKEEDEALNMFEVCLKLIIVIFYEGKTTLLSSNFRE